MNVDFVPYIVSGFLHGMANEMKNSKFVFVFLFVISVCGCSHPISVVPDHAQLVYRHGDPPRFNVAAAYYIPLDAYGHQVVDSVGSGDSVVYFPYKDIDLGFQVMMESIFERVIKLDPASVDDGFSDEIKYVVVPQIISKAGTASNFLWPPETFSVDLTSRISGSDGSEISSPRVEGNGSAKPSEFARDFGIAGRRAMLSALTKMKDSIRQVVNEDVGRQEMFPQGIIGAGGPKRVPEISDESADRLRRLDDLFRDGLITRQEFQEKRAMILKGL